MSASIEMHKIFSMDKYMRNQIGIKKKINITHIRTSHGLAGAERVILGLLQESDKKRFNTSVTLIGSEPGLNRDFYSELKRLNIEVFNFTFKGRFNVKGIVQLRRHILKQAYDIIHCHDFKSNFYGLMSALGTNTGMVTTHHGSTKDDLLLKIYLGINEYALVRCFDRVIAVSKELCNEKWARLIDRGKIVHIPNGIKTDFFDNFSEDKIEKKLLNICKNKIVIGIVGRLFPDKGHTDLFRSIVILKQEYPNLMVLIVGDGPYRSALEKYVKKFQIEDNVFFAGIQANMHNIYKLMNIFVMPSHREGLPMALLEAMLAKVPVIATHVGEIPSVLSNGRYGQLVPICDADYLAKELKSAIKYIGKDQERKRDAAAHVKRNYSAFKMAKDTENIYFSLYQKKKI